jgi:hypothetical protein
MPAHTWRPCPDSLIVEAARLRWTHEHPAPDLVAYLVAYKALHDGVPVHVRSFADDMGFGRHKAHSIMRQAAEDYAAWNDGDRSGTARGQPTTNERRESSTPGDTSGTPARVRARSSLLTGTETLPPKPPQGGAPQEPGRSRISRRRGATSAVKLEPPAWEDLTDPRLHHYHYLLDNNPSALPQDDIDAAYAYAHEHGAPLPVYPDAHWRLWRRQCPDGSNVIPLTAAR